MAEMTIRLKEEVTKVIECNLKYLKFKRDKKANFDMTKFKEIPNQLDKVAQIVCRCNLVCSNCSMQGLIGSITTA